MWYFLSLVYRVIDISLWIIFSILILYCLYEYLSNARWWTKSKFKIYIGRYKWYFKLRKDNNKRYLRGITSLWNVDYLSDSSIKLLLKKRDMYSDEKWLELQDKKLKEKERFKH